LKDNNILFSKDIDQKFSGNSGCKLIIFSQDGYKVRKISTTKKISERLKDQYQKIINFKKVQNITVPRIYKQGMIKKKFYYDMEYFNSVNFSELILKNNYEDSHKSLIKILLKTQISLKTYRLTTLRFNVERINLSKLLKSFKF
jgi:hypothetical protein|tara:strand:+ start:333 stop:764 length:432 start_codon:yes stop_codon:yes gene_type:complete